MFGASMITSGALTLAGLTESSSKMGLGFLVYCVSIFLLSYAGIMIQLHMAYDKCHDQDAEHKENVLLPAD